jgi:hypothetical protein
MEWDWKEFWMACAGGFVGGLAGSMWSRLTRRKGR